MSANYDRQDPGIRNPLWLGGRTFFRGPSVCQMTPHRFEQVTRVSNLGLRLDRPYIPAGAAMPNVRTRVEFNFQWPTLQEDDLLDHLDSLLSVGQPFELALWKQMYDIYDGDGTTSSFLIQRRLALPNLASAAVPKTTFADYPTIVKYLDEPYGTPSATETLYSTVSYKTTSEMAAGNPSSGEAWIEDTGHRVNNLWVTLLKVNPAPDAVKDALVVIYLPLYEVVPDEGQRSYPAGAVDEPRTVRLQELG